LACLPHSSQFITLKPALVAGDAPVGELVIVNGTAHTWQQDNPWTEAAITARRQAAEQFNRGSYAAAAATFRHIEARVSGGQKPLYHASPTRGGLRLLGPVYVQAGVGVSEDRREGP